MTKHYVEISFLGSFVSNSSTQEVEDRDNFVVPEGAFGFQFFDKEVVEIDGETLQGNPKNHSKRFYIGELYTLKDVQDKVPDNEILLSNMRMNEWNTVIKCRQGFLPFDPIRAFVFQNKKKD